MLGATGQPVGFNGMIMPLEAHGVRVISIGFFLPPGKPVAWRGPMLHRAIQQFLTDVYWGDLDYVLADLPPGTGDVSISLAQMLPGAEMLLVTTPQEAAERVAVLAGNFAQQNGMKVTGVIENMSYFVCPSCDERHHIFGSGGGEILARELNTELLGQIPIDVRLREGADAGKPLVVSDPDAPASRALLEVAAALPPLPRSLVGKRLTLLTSGSTGGGPRSGVLALGPPAAPSPSPPDSSGPLALGPSPLCSASRAALSSWRSRSSSAICPSTSISSRT
jgi:ATP-binding protein involved in chromosome partitioning